MKATLLLNNNSKLQHTVDTTVFLPYECSIGDSIIYPDGIVSPSLPINIEVEIETATWKSLATKAGQYRGKITLAVEYEDRILN